MTDSGYLIFYYGDNNEFFNCIPLVVINKMTTGRIADLWDEPITDKSGEMAAFKINFMNGNEFVSVANFITFSSHGHCNNYEFQKELDDLYSKITKK